MLVRATPLIANRPLTMTAADLDNAQAAQAVL